jgi:hypothetical protein
MRARLLAVVPPFLASTAPSLPSVTLSGVLPAPSPTHGSISISSCLPLLNFSSELGSSSPRHKDLSTHSDQSATPCPSGDSLCWCRGAAWSPTYVPTPRRTIWHRTMHTSWAPALPLPLAPPSPAQPRPSPPSLLACHACGTALLTGADGGAVPTSETQARDHGRFRDGKLD